MNPANYTYKRYKNSTKDTKTYGKHIKLQKHNLLLPKFWMSDYAFVLEYVFRMFLYLLYYFCIFFKYNQQDSLICIHLHPIHLYRLLYYVRAELAQITQVKGKRASIADVRKEIRFLEEKNKTTQYAYYTR